MTDDVQIFSHDERSREYPAPYTTVAGNVMASGAFPTDFNLWQVQAEVEPDAELEWAPEHGDEALYVLAGAIRLGEEICGPGSSVVVDSHVAARVHVVEPGSILHCGTWQRSRQGLGHAGLWFGRAMELRLFHRMVFTRVTITGMASRLSVLCFRTLGGRPAVSICSE
jgi:hypothetical protein